MTVRFSTDGVIHLEGICGIDDAEHLLRHLLAAPESCVDWHLCEWAHTAIVQILLNFRPPVIGAPNSAFLEQHIEPLLRPQLAGGAAPFGA